MHFLFDQLNRRFVILLTAIVFLSSLLQCVNVTIKGKKYGKKRVCFNNGILSRMLKQNLVSKFPKNVKG